MRTRIPARFPLNVRERAKRKSLPASVLSGRYRRNDYPQRWYNGRSQGIHRVVWQEKRGPIPKGMVVHHKKGDKANPNPSIRDLELKPMKDHSTSHGGDWARD